MLGRTNRLRTIWEQQLRTPAGRPAGEGFESAAEGWLTCGRVRCVQNRHLHLQQLQDLSWPRRDLHPRRWQGKSCHYDILFATQRAGCESEDRGLGGRRALDRETNRCTLPSGFRVTFSGRILLLLSCRLEGDHWLGLSLSSAAETQRFNSRTCSHRLVCHGLASFVDAMVGLLQLGKPWTGERDTANGCWELLFKRPCVCDAWRSGTDIEQMCPGSRSVSLMARPRLAFT